MRLTLMAASFALATASTALAQTTVQTFSPLAVGEYCSEELATEELEPTGIEAKVSVYEVR